MLVRRFPQHGDSNLFESVLGSRYVRQGSGVKDSHVDKKVAGLTDPDGDPVRSDQVALKFVLRGLFPPSLQT